MGNLLSSHTSFSTIASLNYVGDNDVSSKCFHDMLYILQTYDIESVIIVTFDKEHSKEHGFLLVGDTMWCIRDGVSSGYGGQGPLYLSYMLYVLQKISIDIFELDAGDDMQERMKRNSLTIKDIKYCQTAKRRFRNIDSYMLDIPDIDNAIYQITTRNIPLFQMHPFTWKACVDMQNGNANALFDMHKYIENRIKKIVILEYP